MASQKHTHRSAAIGLSGGLALAVPLAAYAATLPFDGVHYVVRTAGLPFALGAFAGIGFYVMSSAFYESREEAEEAEQVGSDESLFATGILDGGTGMFRRRGADDSVPVIARAVDAMSEAEAWAEIDQLLSEDSPVSCDASTSKDIYQLALEELARAASSSPDSTRAAAAAGGATASGQASAAGPASVSADARDASAAAGHTAGMPALAAGSNGDAMQATSVDLDLDEPSGVFAVTDDVVAAVVAADAAAEAAAVEAAAADAAAEAAAPAAGAPVAAAVAQGAPVGDEASAAFGDDAPVQEVVMVDYTGHEEMWARAIAVLEEDAAPVAAVGSYRPKHALRTDFIDDPARARAVAEGACSTRMHSHVNEILSEELDRVDSQGVRRTSHEYLRVIQGGTASMPALKVEA